MKKIIVLLIALFVFVACANDKKAEEKKIEQSVQKIDSIAVDVQKSTDELEAAVKEVREVLKELDSI